MEVKGVGSYTKTQEGLYVLDQEQGVGAAPSADSEVVFHYTAYNENGGRIDSSYRQGQPVRGRMGINAMIPGFELGIATMRVGGRRRIVVPPELGPPVGPSTFFSARQFEVFDVELVAVRRCTRRTILFYSDEQVRLRVPEVHVGRRECLTHSLARSLARSLTHAVHGRPLTGPDRRSPGRVL